MTPSNFLIQSKQSALEALKIFNTLAIPKLSVFVIDENKKVIGALAEGDVRRGLLEGRSIDGKVSDFMRSNFKYFEDKEDNFKLFNEFKKSLIRFIPVIDKNKVIIEVIDMDLYHSMLPVV
ncbi:MAG TPA: hypothetical protein PLD02_11025, partial [Saprospiraceae bacterium]|nr:hypothetical protein [Saprospiraceae bacterium]